MAVDASSPVLTQQSQILFNALLWKGAGWTWVMGCGGPPPILAVSPAPPCGGVPNVLPRRRSLYNYNHMYFFVVVACITTTKSPPTTTKSPHQWRTPAPLDLLKKLYGYTWGGVFNVLPRRRGLYKYNHIPNPSPPMASPAPSASPTLPQQFNPSTTIQ